MDLIDPVLPPTPLTKPVQTGVGFRIQGNPQTYRGLRVQAVVRDDNGSETGPDAGPDSTIGYLDATLGGTFSEYLLDIAEPKWYRFRLVSWDQTQTGAWTVWFGVRSEPIFVPPPKQFDWEGPQAPIDFSQTQPISRANWDLAGHLDGDTEVRTGDLFLDTPGVGDLIKTGTIASPADQTITVRVPNTRFVPIANDPAHSFGADLEHNLGELTPTDDTDATCYAAIVIPDGITITALRSRAKRNAVGDAVDFAFRRISDTAGVTAVDSWSQTVSASFTTVTRTISESVSGSNTYQIQCILNPGAGNSKLDTSLLYCELDLDLSDYLQQLTV